MNDKDRIENLEEVLAQFLRPIRVLTLEGGGMGSVKFSLTVDERAEIDKPVNGSGGYQTLLRQLQKSIGAKNNLSVDDELLGRIVRMCAYGSGGFQGRLRSAFKNHIRGLVSW